LPQAIPEPETGTEVLIEFLSTQKREHRAKARCFCVLCGLL